MDQQRFLQQLQTVLNPAQGNVKEATGILQKEFYKDSASLLFLIQLVTSHDDPNLRQLAAVEARGLVAKHWLSIAADQKPNVRNTLLQSTLNETGPLVRHAGARVISSIAKLDIMDGEWADLPNFLLQSADTGKADERAIAIYILFSILETLGEGFEEKFQDLFTLFSKTIRDPESAEVRINTLLALSRLAVFLDSEENEAPVKAFQEILPSMVAVLEDAIGQKDEDKIMQAFEVFQSLLGCDPQLMSPHLKELVTFMDKIATNTELEEDTRVQAISFLMQCVRFRKLRVQGMRIGEQLTRSALHIVTELGSADADDDDITPARSSLGLLDILAQTLPPSQVVVPLLQALGNYFNSENPDYRRAGILALGMCVEGAPEFFSTQIKEIFPMVLQLLSDPEARVRQASLHGVARLADDLAEELSKEHARLMPLLLKNLQSAMQEYQGEESGSNIDIMKAAVAAIDAVVSGLDQTEIQPYQDELIPVLHKLLKHPDFKIKALAASALGSIASASGEAFLPYFDQSMHAMQEYATIKDSEDELELRANVTDAMGEMSASAGPEHFKPYVQPLMQASEEALHLDHSRLKESTYILWGSMSRVYGEDFTPFIEGVVKGLFDCLDQDETDLEVQIGAEARDLVGTELTIGGRKVTVADSGEGLEGAEIEDVDIDDDDEWDDDLTTVTPVSLEKEIALDVIGDLITHAKKAYLPYFEKTIEKITPLAEHQYEGVRKSVIGTLHRSYAALWTIAEEGGQMGKWEPGLPLKVQPASEVKKFGEILITATLKMWTDEEDRACISDLHRNLAENLKFCGPALVADAGVVEKIVTMVTSIVNKEHPCQQDFGPAEEDQEELEESSEFDWDVIDSALDVVSGLAAALGDTFTEVWKIFEKTVFRFAASSESMERATAVGVIAECITGMESAVTPYTASFHKVLMRRLSDEDPQTKSNAAYAIGRLCEKTNDNSITASYPEILSKLEACMHNPECRLPDNSAGCLSRMILKHRDHVPMADVLPALVGILPLKTDYDENEPVYQMICQLYKWEDATVQQLTPSLLPVFQAVLAGGEEQLDDEERRKELIELVKWLNKMQPGSASWVEELGA